MFECEVCGRDFAASKHLKQHILASLKHSPEHLGLCCQQCDSKIFTSVTGKYQHLISSSKHHICTLCPEPSEFDTKRQLKAHYKRQHPSQSPGNTQLNTERLASKIQQDTQPVIRPHTCVKGRYATVPSSSLDRFLARYPSFLYDASLPPATSYRALIQYFGWDRDSEEAKNARSAYQEALNDEVNLWFGREDDLDAWHTLCRAVGVGTPPDTIRACTHVLRNTHVNIVDLVQWGRTGGSQPVQVFATQKELVDYSMKSGKIFPSRDVHVEGETNVVLRHLLRKFARRRASIAGRM